MHVLYEMAMLPMTFSDHQPTNHPDFCIFVAFRIFVLGEHKDFIFGTQLNHG